MEPRTDPFDLLKNAGSDPGLWFLIAAPIGLLFVVGAIAAIVIYISRRREARLLIEDVNAESLSIETPVSGEDRRLAPNLAEPEPVVPTPSRPQLKVVPKAADPEPSGEDQELSELRGADRSSWLSRLRDGLSKTRDSFRASIEAVFTGKTRIDAGVLERLHEALYRADIGVATADKLVDKVRKTLEKDESTDWLAVARCLKQEAREILERPTKPLNVPAEGPWIILVVGVNGVGKTTTIGKLAAHFLAQDKKVLLAAGDTFRAAAIEQLEVWGKRLGVEVIKHKQGSDPAAVAYDGVKAAMARKMDVLIIDTAGRLHSRKELMQELEKVTRVIGKDLPGAPHETWLVVDATTGQNAVQQVKAFSEIAGVTGLVVTKLDGTAKGGVVVGISDQFGLPVRYIGVGEKAKDLRDFKPAEFVESLF